MIRSHEQLLALITRYGLACMDRMEQVPEMLAEIDKTLFDLYDLHGRILPLASMGALEGCGVCAEIAEIVRSEIDVKPWKPHD